MTSPRALLSARGLKPKKSFGQNFLTDARVIDAIADACVPSHERGIASVVEIGPGTGALTGALLERARRVVAIERDRDLVPLLRDAFSESTNLQVLEADAKAVDLKSLVSNWSAPRVLAGNLPYQLTGQLLERATEVAGAFERAIFMVQYEVAERLLANPGTKTYGALTVFVRAAYRVRKVMQVSPQSFYPAPDVTSTVIELTPEPRATETEAFRKVVKAAFGMRRKTLRNAWAALGPEMARAADSVGISLDARGETLDVDDFARVAAAWSLILANA